jgi:hypothetical protein
MQPPICELMSPIISIGKRVLCSIIRIISMTGSPRERSLTVRNWIPSWKMSVANFDSEPISRPPTSIQCITTTMKPTSTLSFAV